MRTEATLRSHSPVRFGRLESLLQLFALSSLAVAQPLLDILGQFGEFLVAHQLEPVEILTVALVLVAVLPLALWMVVLLAFQVSARGAGWLHLVFAGALAGLWALRGLAALEGLGSIPAFAGAVAAGLLASWLLYRRPSVRTVVSWAAVGGVVFAGYFLFFSPVARLLRGFEAEPGTSRIARGDESRPPLVLIVFDELPLGSLLTPEGEVDAGRFPHFAALAADGVFYTRATTVTSGTAYAVPAILTGRYPAERKFPIHLDYRENLFTLLGNHYRIHAHETLTQLCPQDLCARETPPLGERIRSLASDLKIVYLHLILPSEAASRLPSITGRWRDFAANWRPDGRGGVVGVERSERLDIPGVVERYVDEIDSDRSVLHYLHLELPHVPWRYLPSGTEYGPVEQAIGVDEEAAWRDDGWLLTLALQRHLAQTVYADRVLGQIVAALRDRGLYDDALLLVTADHGLAFQMGEPARRLTEANIAEVASVPLLLRGPGVNPGREESPVEVVDIVPTLVEAAGVELPWPVDGRSLLDPSYRGRESKQLIVPEEGLRAAVSAREVGESNLAAARRIAAAFPRPGVEGLFQIGRSLELVDRPTAALAQRAGGNVEVALGQRWFYDAVDPGSGFLPARVDGRLRSSAPIDSRRGVAVSINGIVRAVTLSYPDQGAERFSALLPERAFAAGANTVEIFVVEEDSTSGPVLVPAIDRSGPGYSLARSDSGDLVGIEATNGTGCRLTEAAVIGGAFREGLTFWGWALDPAGNSPMVVIMAFVDGSLVWAGPTGTTPPAVDEPIDQPGFETSGFVFGLTRPLLPRGDDSELRIFGVVGEVCSELPVVDN